ncbi:MAG: rhomboid family intramembrane serine protease [Terriglobales bacterium]
MMRRSGSNYNTMSLSFPPFTRAVKWLLIANGVIFLLDALVGRVSPGAGRDITIVFSLIPAAVMHGYIWQVVTYSFLHGGLWHLLGNMLMLWMFGSQFETDWGTSRFLEFYFFCVVGAALSTIVIAYTGLLGLTPSTPTIGASGGIYGILLAYGIIYANREIMLFPIPFTIKAKYFVIGLIFITLYLSVSGPGGIAYVAHLGGLLFGFLFIRFMPRHGVVGGASERYFGLRNAYYRWKRRRAARKFEVYMRKHDRSQYFDEYGNFRDPDKPPPEKGNGEHRGPWVN